MGPQGSHAPPAPPQPSAVRQPALRLSLSLSLSLVCSSLPPSPPSLSSPPPSSALFSPAHCRVPHTSSSLPQNNRVEFIVDQAREHYSLSVDTAATREAVKGYYSRLEGHPPSPPPRSLSAADVAPSVLCTTRSRRRLASYPPSRHAPSEPPALEKASKQAAAPASQPAVPAAHRLLDGKSVLDVGCGGGILAEPMAYLGAALDPLRGCVGSASPPPASCP